MEELLLLFLTLLFSLPAARRQTEPEVKHGSKRRKFSRRGARMIDFALGRISAE